MNRLFRFLPLAMIALMLGGFSIGCETMKGAGEDIENAGDGIQDATN